MKYMLLITTVLAVAVGAVQFFRNRARRPPDEP
jgi:hypothetical protein